MNIKRSKLTVICGLVLMAAFLSSMGLPGAVSAVSLLPAGAVVADTFTPGFGAPIAKVQRVKGEVVVLHAHEANKGYRVRPGLMLYKGDTIVTMKKGKVRFKMNDGSILSLASRTKLELNKSVYDQKKKSRSSFLNMAFGKARFLVAKLLKFKRSEFKVKTPTAVCGVRGSDFVIEASPQITSVTSFEKTTIEIASLKYPEAAPIVVPEFHTSKVYLGGRPTDPVKLTPEEIQRLKEQFISVDPADAEPEEDEVQGETGMETGVTAIAMKDVRVLVPEDTIVDLPEDFEVKDVDRRDISNDVERSGVTKEKPGLVQADIVEQVREGILGSLPDFPQMPE
ncbi:MAG: FecR domain-containing protein [Deltaproteobacteria bacterium]|nr:FecR domain-containing protein [Deltaproteobacteria bacterium]MBW2676152.1 FecR domain-containing protein [Deltaproteobacteria bacterium]